MNDRRGFLRTATAGLGAGLFGTAFDWRHALAGALGDGRTRRHVVLLWMTGGPSQLDTFDLKPGHANGGEFRPIDTSVPGLQFSEHLPQLAKHAHRLAVVRSLTTKEGDHGRGTYLLRTGSKPGGPLRHPTLGSLVAKELGSAESELPQFVSIGPYRLFSPQAFEPGFLGPQYAPLTVGATDRFVVQPTAAPAPNAYADLRVDDLSPPGDLTRAEWDRRTAFLAAMQSDFAARHAVPAAAAHRTTVERAERLMRGSGAAAFDLSREPEALRARYGRGRFGQGCLMARRLIEEGVPFVEVSLGQFGGGNLAWDTHVRNFAAVKDLSAELDAGWSTLLDDLADRGLLDHVTFLWIGEFGRTPKINPSGGRDHFPAAWSCVLGGAGIRGGQAFGSTSPDGMQVAEQPVEVGQVLATTVRAAGIDPARRNLSELGRPIRIVEGEPIEALLA